VGCGFSQQVVSQEPAATRIERTENVHRQWIEKLTAKNYEFASLTEQQVKVKSQDPCGFEAQASQTNKDGFQALSLHDKLCLQIDDHGDAYLFIESILTTEVSLRYEYKFDHGSFGAAKQSVDQGVFKVKLQGQVKERANLPDLKAKPASPKPR
jgi:hypothetical protein